ncbi:MAG: flavodoxin [Oscillospiraceae bacterium]|nr:flavodoxin [Oscillospiraceae bacterium]
MKKVAVVYWSGTGNTEAMANAVKQGAGAGAELFTASEFGPDDVSKYDAFAFGCPAMGSEQLEDGEFEPMFDSVKNSLSGKSVALFGSYGWGSGDWMRTWEEDCLAAGVILACDSVICNDAPDDEAIQACKALGAALV